MFAAVKAVVLFLVVVAALRLSERRTLSEFAVYDFVVAVAVGAIIDRTVTTLEASVLVATAALVALLGAHALVARLRFLPGLARVIDKPVRVLVRDGQVQHRELRRCGLTDDDLASLLRQHGHPDAATVAPGAVRAARRRLSAARRRPNHPTAERV